VSVDTIIESNNNIITRIIYPIITPNPTKNKICKENWVSQAQTRKQGRETRRSHRPQRLVVTVMLKSFQRNAHNKLKVQSRIKPSNAVDAP
jgi:hypothetical protein